MTHQRIKLTKGKDRFKDKNVVITGGSSGIGLATAVEFAKLGSKIHLIARKLDLLKKANEYILNKVPESKQIEIYCADVSNLEEINSVIQQIGTNYDGIHTLINNAGVMLCGRFEDNPVELMEHVFRINYFGMLYATRAALPFIRASGGGHFGFVSSVAGYTGLIGYSSYAPTKFSTTGLAESLRMEFETYGIGVTVVFPPDTKTPLLEYERLNTLPESLALSKKAKMVTPELVANKFVNGIVKNQFEVYCNFQSRITRVLKGIFPSLYYTIIDGIVKKTRQKGNSQKFL